MADDKVRRLSETLFDISEQGLAIPENLERILRAELKPLLDAASDLADGCSMTYYQVTSAIERLDAELKHWRRE